MSDHDDDEHIYSPPPGVIDDDVAGSAVSDLLGMGEWEVVGTDREELNAKLKSEWKR